MGNEPGAGAGNGQLSDGSSREKQTAPIFLAFEHRGSNMVSGNGAPVSASSCLCLHPPWFLLHADKKLSWG